MAITFQPGTKLVLTDKVNRYEFLVSSATASQTFVESKQNIKTIHNPNLLERTFSTEKSNTSLDFSCYLSTDGAVEGILFKWFGFPDEVGRYKIRSIPIAKALQGSEEILDIYIDAGTSIYYVNNCVGSNISFAMNKSSPLQVTISAMGVDLTQVASIPAYGTLFSQDSANFQIGTLDVTGFSNISAVSCEITRSVNWLGQKSVHDIGSVYIKDTPVLKDFSISGTVTQYKTDNSNDYVEDTTIEITYNSSFTIYLPNCSTTDRWDLGTVHMKATDYKLLPSNGGYIEF